MRCKNILVVLMIILSILILPLVLAIKTPILVYSHPNHTVSINIVNPETENSLEHFVGNSGKSGIFSKDASVTREFKVILLASKNKKFAVPPVTFGNYTPGQTLEFLLTKTDVKEITNQEPEVKMENKSEENNKSESKNSTITESVPEQNQSEENISNKDAKESINETNLAGITGKAVSENEGPGLRSIFVKIGAIIFLAIFSLFAVFLTLKTISKRKTKTQEKNEKIKLTKYQDFKDKMQKNKEVDKKLSEAEKRLKQTQEEVDRLKKIKEIESEMHKKEKELNRLKRKE